jgi:hypothetical protein
LTGKGYTNPIIHTKASPANNITVQGNVSEYEISDLENGNIEIKKFVGFDQAEMVIPTEINGKKVVRIGRDAFKQCNGIKHLIVPEGIENISAGAFAGCKELSTVILPTSLKHLGNAYGTGAFEGTAITKIDIPNGITSIGAHSFEGCERLVQILFPDNLMTIRTCAFRNCNSLTEVILPSTVIALESRAFSFCGKLSKVKLNEGLRIIEGYVFHYDPVLTYLAIPKSVKKFGEDFFGGGSPVSTKNVTIGCYPGSKAIEYARLNNIKMKDLSK